MGYKVCHLCSDSNGIVCSHKISAKIEMLKNKLLAILDIDSLNSEYQSIYNNICVDSTKIIRCVSGKSYLMPLLDSRI